MVQAAPAAAQPQPAVQPQPATPPPAAPAAPAAAKPPEAPAATKPAETQIPAGSGGPTAAEFATLKTERDTLQTRLTQTDAAVETLRSEMNQLKLQGIPTEQRAAAQRDLDLQAESRRLENTRAELNKAALVVMAQDISNKTGVEVEELRGFATTSEMQDFAINRQVELQREPGYVEAMARLHGYVKAPADPNAPPPPGQAPGATQPPAGAPAQTAGTQPIGEDVVAKILADPKIGRGTGEVENALAAIRENVGLTEIVFVGADRATAEPSRTYQPPPPAGEPPQQPAQVPPGQVPGTEAGNPPGAIDVVNTNR